MANLLLLGKRYEAYVTVITGQAGGPLVYRDAAGHFHTVPTGPDTKRVAEALEPHLGQLERQLNQIATIMEGAGKAA